MRFLPALLLLILLALTACERATGPRADTGAAVDVAGVTGRELPVDTSASALGWHAYKVTRSHDGGFHSYDGTVTRTDSAVTGVRLNIQAPSIWSDTERLTTHLKSADFFDVMQFPAASFEASRIVTRDTAGATHLVTGNLMMHGVTQGVTFPATIRTYPDSVRAKAEFVIDRTRWGIIYKGAADDLISNDVTIKFDVLARGSAASAPADSSAR